MSRETGSGEKSRFPSHEIASAMDRLSIRCGKHERAIAVLHSRPTRRDGKHDKVRRKARGLRLSTFLSMRGIVDFDFDFSNSPLILEPEQFLFAATSIQRWPFSFFFFFLLFYSLSLSQNGKNNVQTQHRRLDTRPRPWDMAVKPWPGRDGRFPCHQILIQTHRLRIHVRK
jgi:hypothetical protein